MSEVMSRRPRMDDYRRSDGTHDWDALRLAEVENGWNCWQCGQGTLRGGHGRTRCTDCLLLDGAGEVMHPEFIRCPMCGGIWRPVFDAHVSSRPGSHGVTCLNCDHLFEVTTEIRRAFVSPAMARPNR